MTGPLLTMADRAAIDDEMFAEMAARGEHPFVMVKSPDVEPDWDDPQVQEAARQAHQRIRARQADARQAPFADTDR